MLKINNLSKSFGKKKALDDINFVIEPGEFVFLIGESGAGKTTLLRLITRELLPDSGEILFEEKDITKLKRKEVPGLRQRIGVVFQDFKVLPERTLSENISVALAVCGVPQVEWHDRVGQVLELVNLKDRAKLFPSQLSGGELQRAALARALVINPEVILADEPTGNLDWDTAESIVDLFKTINSEGKTVIMATHNKIIVEKLKQRVIELSAGKLIKDTQVKQKIKVEVRDKDDNEDEVKVKDESEDKSSVNTKDNISDDLSENREHNDDKNGKKVNISDKLDSRE